jgi:nitrogen fixation protein NifU and related proteins
MSELAQLYQESILDHHRRPRNPGRLPDATHASEGHNPLCGDRVTITVRVADAHVLGVCCEARGCALCRASGSMLTEAVLGLTLSEVVELAVRFCRVVGAPAARATAATVEAERSDSEQATLGPLLALTEVRNFPSRIRCATLSWEVLQAALESS